MRKDYLFSWCNWWRICHFPGEDPRKTLQRIREWSRDSEMRNFVFKLIDEEDVIHADYIRWNQRINGKVLLRRAH